MKNLIVMLLCLIQLGTESYINPVQVVNVYRHWSRGNRYHAGHYDGLTVIELSTGKELLSEWPIEKVLKVLKAA